MKKKKDFTHKINIKLKCPLPSYEIFSIENYIKSLDDHKVYIENIIQNYKNCENIELHWSSGDDYYGSILTLRADQPWTDEELKEYHKQETLSKQLDNKERETFEHLKKKFEKREDPEEYERYKELKKKFSRGKNKLK